MGIYCFDDTLDLKNVGHVGPQFLFHLLSECNMGIYCFDDTLDIENQEHRNEC